MSAATGANDFYNDELIIFGQPKNVRDFLNDVDRYLKQLFRFVTASTANNPTATPLTRCDVLWGDLHSTGAAAGSINSVVVVSVEVSPSGNLGLDSEQRLPVWRLMRPPRKVNIAYFAGWHLRPLTRKHRVLLSLNPTATGNPYGVGGDPYGVGGDPYGVGGDPYGVGGDPYGVGGDPYGVGGDPYGVGGDPYGVGGDPYGVGGDPYGVGGDPYGVGGDPYGVGGDPLTVLPVMRATEDEFKKQKAFEIIGLNNSTGNRLVTQDGTGVVVGVFDTFVSSVAVSGMTLPNIDPALNNPFLDISDHSVSVISLIKAVAPQAQVLLYGVLNDDGEGNLNDLIAALYKFTNMVVDQSKMAVINLSLGSLGLNLNELPLMAQIFGLIEKQGIVVVAASGNDTRRARKLVAVRNSQVPGALNTVLSVAGCTRDKTRATFSNLGDVAAPSGNVIEYEPSELKDLEKPIIKPIDDDTVIGQSQLATPMDGTTYGYRRWKGTSFATPLVSGAAALVLQSLPNTVNVGDRAAVVRRAILDSAVDPLASLAAGTVRFPFEGLGEGILNIGGAVTNSTTTTAITTVAAVRTAEAAKETARIAAADAQRTARIAERASKKAEKAKAKSK